MQLCTEAVPVEMVKILLDHLDLTQENQEPLAVCHNSGIKEQANILGNLTTRNNCFTIDDIQKGEMAEYWIPRVKKILKRSTRLSSRHRRSESKEIQQLLRQESTFFISGDVSYTVNIRNNTMSYYHMLLRKQFTDSCI